MHAEQHSRRPSLRALAAAVLLGAAVCLAAGTYWARHRAGSVGAGGNARPRIQELLAQLPGTTDPSERDRLLEALADIQRRSGDLPAAADTAERRMQEATGSAARHAAALALAEVWRLQGTLQARTEALERGLAQVPEDAGSVLLLAEVSRGLQPDRKRWIELHERLVHLVPDDDVATQRLAAAYREDGNAAALFRLYRDLFRQAHDKRQQVAARDGLIRLWWEFGKLDEAVSGLESARQRDPQDPEALAFLAEIYWDDLDRFKDAAVPVYETLARLHPEDLHTQQRLVETYYRVARYEDEIRLAAATAERFPDARFDLYVTILAACARAGDKAKFLAWKDRTIAEFGTQAWTYAKVAQAANDYADLQPDPELWELVISLCEQGLAGPAAEAAKAPYMPHIVGNFYLQKAKACVRLGRKEEALALFEQVERNGVSEHLRKQAAMIRDEALSGAKRQDETTGPSGSRLLR